jgi:hypothetical protein
VKTYDDAEFAAWCASSKPCRYCNRMFVGPCCPFCEQPIVSATRTKKP